MRAVWSFWSKPHYSGLRHSWIKEFHHVLAWSLSVQEASKHYPDTWLYTDTAGARLLVEKLQLPFARVCTSLDKLDKYDPRWWSLGKLHTYRLQKEPFVHIDCDVFLWLPLPDWLTSADVFSQNPEPFSAGASFYQPEKIEQVVAATNGWLPQEWKWYRASSRNLHGDCCGIVGGNRPDFIQYWADLAFQVVEHHANRYVIAQIEDKIGLMVVLEQFLLAACLVYHGCHKENSSFCNISSAYLFGAGEEVFNQEKTAKVGYTHLIGDTKLNHAVGTVLENRMLRDYPEQFERCRKFIFG
jgi:hypothetical protein